MKNDEDFIEMVKILKNDKTSDITKIINEIDYSGTKMEIEENLTKNEDFKENIVNHNFGTTAIVNLDLKIQNQSYFVENEVKENILEEHNKNK